MLSDRLAFCLGLAGDWVLLQPMDSSPPPAISDSDNKHGGEIDDIAFLDANTPSVATAVEATQDCLLDMEATVSPM